jgi:hypothetical protein
VRANFRAWAAALLPVRAWRWLGSREAAEELAGEVINSLLAVFLESFNHRAVAAFPFTLGLSKGEARWFDELTTSGLPKISRRTTDYFR